jgi:hypothetical protein
MDNGVRVRANGFARRWNKPLFSFTNSALPLSLLLAQDATGLTAARYWNRMEMRRYISVLALAIISRHIKRFPNDMQ